MWYSYSFDFYFLYVVFRYKKIGPNLHFGYRTKFSLSSKEKWDWSNNTFAQFTFIFAPSFLFIHIIIFILTVVHEWFFLWVILSMGVGSYLDFASCDLY